MSMIIKGGEPAIRESYKLIAEQRRGDRSVPEISVTQIREQLGLGVDRVMCEGALYDRTLAALAIKQAQCDLSEAVFLLRAFRTTLRRFGTSKPVDTKRMLVRRRVATVYKDPPGGQFLGATFDYTHRLLDFSLLDDEASAPHTEPEARFVDVAAPDTLPSIEDMNDGGEIVANALDSLHKEDLLETPPPASEAAKRPADLTRQPLSFPANRDLRLQALARGDEGFLVGLAYSSLQGTGSLHPYIADLRIGEVGVVFVIPELGFEITICDMTVTECQIVNPVAHSAAPEGLPTFTRGYGVVFGQSERKALSVALLDRTLRAAELGEDINGPAQDQEFVLANSDGVATAGLIQHLKLPHYVDFQGRLQIMRQIRAERAAPRSAGEAA
jgi:alpha-D-ribose 1-methylphosphonate 5-triphosphate synthase subunit PhnI